MHCQKPCHMVCEQGGVKYWPELIMCPVDRLFPYYVTGACVRTDPPSCFFYLARCLFNPSSECCLISMQNHCHMDYWTA